MRNEISNPLTCIFENGDEKTLLLDSDTIFNFVKWFYDSTSSNCIEVIEEIGLRSTIFKNNILALRY